MVISYTGESENEGCGGTEGGNDCLWWCCKVGLCAFLYLCAYMCICICVYGDELVFFLLIVEN